MGRTAASLCLDWGRVQPPPLGHWNLHASDTYEEEVPSSRSLRQTLPKCPLLLASRGRVGGRHPTLVLREEEKESKGCSCTRHVLCWG